MKYFEPSEYGLYSIKNNSDLATRFFAGVKVKNTEMIYLLSLNECFMEKDLVNIFDNNIGHDIYFEKKNINNDDYHHNKLIVNHNGEESVVAEFLTFNADAKKILKAPDNSCTLGLLLKNERSINRNLKKFFKEKLAELNEEYTHEM